MKKLVDKQYVFPLWDNIQKFNTIPSLFKAFEIKEKNFYKAPVTRDYGTRTVSKETAVLPILVQSSL